MPLAIWDDGVWQDAVAVAVIILVAYLVVMWIAAVVWTYRDITSRTRDTFTQTVSVLTVLVFSLPGIFLYLILRPKDTIADRYDRQLEAEALLHEIQEQATCPACRRRVQDDFVACPYCRTTLRVPCDSCEKPLLTRWVVCPYCGTNRGPQALPTRAQPVAVAPSTASTVTAAEAATETQPLATRPRRPRRPSTATFTPPAPAKPATPSTDGADATS
jgi:hypothetical protein